MNLSSEHFSACYGKREKKVGGGDEREVEGTNQTLIKKPYNTTENHMSSDI